MSKLLKLRISKVVSNSFHSCRSKDPCTLPQHPVQNTQLITPPPPPSQTKKGHVSAAVVIAAGQCSSRNEETSHDSHTRSHSQEFKWKKEDDKYITSSSLTDENVINYTNEKANWDYHDDMNITNEDEEDEIETIVSSSCKTYMEFSDDLSSNFSQDLETIYKNTTTRRPKKIATTKRRVKNTRGIKNKNGRRSSILMSTSSSDGELPPRLSELISCSVEGKVKESFAIMKKSEDPYEDFKSSMMEMILEKKMFEKHDLEQLLECFLSINAKNYHGVIVEAFSEIWKTLFSPNHN